MLAFVGVPSSTNLPVGEPRTILRATPTRAEKVSVDNYVAGTTRMKDTHSKRMLNTI
jgi:hypothetical protein